ncbi:phage tail tape measure protein [Escherichia coli]|uniref:phage tail tape measure protein n=22 Tax=Gammaproteobacteria TaxID=1236 RepID=UPI00103073AA|nr:phage tail tape measure protein [Escherichia coli]
MAEPVGDLVVDLSLDAARFDEQMARVRRHFSGTESDAKKTAAVVEQSLSRQALAAQKAGISVGQYKAAMRMLPAQFTDVATQLAGGQSPWLILLQQGGQVKDSFGGMIPMFRGLAGAITLPMVGATSLAAATGALAYAWYQGNSTLSDFNKTLVLSGNQSGLTADRMLVLSRAGQAAGLTFNQTSESLSALVKAGVSGEAQIASISQSVARFSSASGVEVDKVAEAFGKLTTDPTSGLTAMARQFHNVTAEQIAYVAQLQRSGDESGALQAANEAATKGFDDQTRRLKENMGTLETWADRTARAFKSMWDAVLDIGRPDTAQEMLIKAEAAFKKADDIWNLRKDDYFVNDEARARYWDDREKARLALEAARKKAEQQSQQDKNAQQQSDTEASRLKYTEEAQKAYERLQTPLEKYTARQEELNKALKDGKILQADYNTLMAAAKKDYEATLKKPKQSGVKVSAGDRQEDSAHAALLTLQAELRTLEKHAGANEKISQQRRDLWKAESQFAVLEEAAQRRQLSAQEKSLLAHKDETLEYKRQLAALGDKVTYQERLNALAQQADKFAQQQRAKRAAKSLLAHKDETLEYKRQLAALGDKVTYQERLNALAQQADKFAQQQRAKRAAIDAKSRGLTDRQAEREATEQRLKEQYGDNPLALNNVMSEQKKTWAAEDLLRGNWMAGLKSGWSEWEESATDSMSQVKSAATQTFDGIAQNMAAMLTGSEQNWRSFTRSVLSMMTEILLKQAMVGIVGSIGSAIGGAVGGGASASGGTAIQAAAAKLHFATGGFTGTGGKYEPAGIVHRGEFVFTKEATSRIGVGNLYRLMRGYATGGYVGGTGSPAQMRRSEGIRFEQNNNVVIQNDGTNGLPGPQMMKAVYDMARKGARDEIQAQMRDGGLFSGGGR